MPRGTIHEAIAQDEFSTHVTISMYQKYNMKLLLNRIVPRLLESAFSCDIRYRRGLPLRMCEKLGSYAALHQVLPPLYFLQQEIPKYLPFQQEKQPRCSLS